MQLESYVHAICDDLANAAAVGDEATARVAGLLTVALESSLRRRFQEGLSEAALELSGQLDQGRVEVRIAGGDPELVYVADAGPATADPPDATFSARITLRLPESLKSRLETAAAAAGVSVNSWIVQSLSRTAEPRSAVRSGHRLTGFGQS